MSDTDTSTRDTDGRTDADDTVNENAWRGVAAEDREDIPDKVSLVLQERSRRLLKQLLRPHKKLLILLMIAVLIENAARLSVPFLVAAGIDKGIPPIQAGEGAQTLFMIVGVVLVAVVVQAITRIIF